VADSLSEETSLDSAITSIQSKCGLDVECCEPALEFLDVLEVTRSSVYATMLDQLKADLLSKISTASKEDLSTLLLECIRFIKIPQLKPIVIAIINKLGEVPIIHLQAIVRGQLLDDMPPGIRRQAWDLSPKLFVEWMKKMSSICSLSDSKYMKTYIKSLCEVVLGSEKLCRFVSQFYLDYARTMASTSGSGGATNGGELSVTGSMFYREIICYLGTPTTAGTLSNDSISISQRTIPQFSMLSTIAMTVRAILTRRYVLMGKTSVQQKFGGAGEETTNECKVLYKAFKSLVTSQLGAVNHAIQRREALIRSMSGAVADSNKRKREDELDELPAKGRLTGPPPTVTILPVVQWPVVLPPGAAPPAPSEGFLKKLLNDMALALAKLDKQGLFLEPVRGVV
jgi:hypothetical protein